MIRKTVSCALLGLVVLAVAGCSNTREDRPGLDILKALTQREAAPVTLDSQQVDAVVAATLQATDIPLALATFQNTENNVVLREIARNGEFRTWSDAGTSERRNITTRNGMLTSTRGLTRDLMSSDISESLALISARSAGSATRVQRYLDGENQIVPVIMQCSISRGDPVRVQVGEINRMAIQMMERCDDGTQSFTNIFNVDDSGRILQSAQWMNDVFGIVVIQQLQ
jgi:hypothetical protein